MKLNYHSPFRNILSVLYIISSLVAEHSILAQQISEIMFTPSESNSEFIELYNSTNETINLSNYKISYHTSLADEIISNTSEYNLLPNKYAIIFEADYEFSSGPYLGMIPYDALIFVLEDNAFGRSGMANFSDRKVSLINSVDDTMDVYTYSANNEIGYSDERIDMNENYWENSILFNGTPGKKNSISPFEYDLALTKFGTSLPYAVIGNSIESFITIKNVGLGKAEKFKLHIYSGKNMDSLIHAKYFNELNSLDSLIELYSLSNLEEGENTFLALIEFETDEFRQNDSAILVIRGIDINEIRGDAVINEFMYAPKNGESEWIELFNRSNKIINLHNYKMADNSDTTILTGESINIDPDEYLVFFEDSSFLEKYGDEENFYFTDLLTLNNSGDDLILVDSLDRVIDSLSYTSFWGGDKGNSLERIDAFGLSIDINNWSESISPSPGKINSVTQKEYDLIIDTVYSNPQFPIISSKFMIVAKIRNGGKNDLNYSIKLSEVTKQDTSAKNLLIESELFELESGSSINYQFYYEITALNSLQNFAIELSTSDDDSSNNYYPFEMIPSYPAQSIIINEIMYSPTNLEPEWIEVYNNSEYEINLKEWLIGDVLTNPVFRKIEHEITLPSKRFLVITKNKNLYEFHNNISSAIIELPFANLNNDEDGVVIKDNNYRTIDSLKFVNNWGGKNGKSLERINVDYGSTNMNNWNSSIDLEGSTPGRINSITIKNYDLSVTSLFSDPKYPVKNDEILIGAEIMNYGSYQVENFDVYLSVNEKLFERFENLQLFSGDSVLLVSSKTITISDTLQFSASIVYNLDEDINNNFYERTIISGFNQNSVLVNEIMFKPNIGEPEWIEIINNSDSSVNLKNWMIGDLTNRTIITEESLFLDSGEFLIISNYFTSQKFDSDIQVIQIDLPSLGNTKEAVALYDFRNALIDSAYYLVKSDFNISTSLERISLELSSIDQSNWTFSLDLKQSTPGKENSIVSLPDYFFDNVIITEIMYDPTISNSEFLEIYNNSDRQIEIGGWRIMDENHDYLSIIDKSFHLKQGNYFVISADSSILENYDWLVSNENLSIINKSSLNLPNSGKRIYLKDVKNNIIDSIQYSDSWHNSAFLDTKNISLELINSNLVRNKSRNWSSSVSELGATPGIVNSINVENLVTNSKLEITPNPFSPDNDGFEDFTFINYNLTQPISQVRVRIFDSKGRFVRSLANNQSVGSQGTVLFDGLDNNKNPLRIGIYIILFEAVNTSNAVVDVIKDVVVVARKL